MFFPEINEIVERAIHQLFYSCGDFLTPLFRAICYLGDYGIFPILFGLILLFFRQTRRIGFGVLIAVLIGFLLTNLLLKNIIREARPFIDQSSFYYQYWLDTGSLMESGHSFPSGHTTSAASFAFGFFLLSKNKKYTRLILIFPILMGVARIYFSVHYFCDVVGGLLVGLIAGLIALILFNVFKRTNFGRKFFRLDLSI